MKIFKLLLLLIFTLNSYSQTLNANKIKIELGTSYQTINGDKKYFNYGTAIIAVKNTGKDLIIQKLDKDSLSEISREVYKVKELFPKHWVNEGMKKIGESIYLFYSSLDKGIVKKERLFARRINAITGKLDISFNRPLVITNGKIYGERLAKGWRVKTVNKFEFRSSWGTPLNELNQKLLITYNKKLNKRNKEVDYDFIGAVVFDASLNQLWKGEFKMPYQRKDIYVFNALIASSGEMYALIYRNVNDANEGQYELLHFNKEITRVEVLGVYKAKKPNTEVVLTETFDGKLRAVGTYDEVNILGAITGFVSVTFNTNGSLVNEYTAPITNDIYEQYIASHLNKSKKKIKGAEHDIPYYPNYRLKEVLHDTEGGIILIGEQFDIKSGTYATSSGRSTNYYYYDDVLMTKIAANGAVEWIVNLPKRQSSMRYQGAMSYKHLFCNKKHLLLYLDDKKNVGLSMHDTPVRYKSEDRGVLMAYVVADANGTVKKEVLLNTKKSTISGNLYQFSTKRIVSGDNDDFYIEFYRKRKEDVMIKFDMK